MIQNFNLLRSKTQGGHLLKQNGFWCQERMFDMEGHTCQSMVGVPKKIVSFYIQWTPSLKHVVT